MDEQKDIQVLTTVRKDILDKVIIENRTDLVNYLYNIVLDIKNDGLDSGKYLRKTRIINLYNNKIGNKYI